MSGSFLDELRETRQHVLKHSRKELAIPGTADRIVVRFRPPADEAMLRDIVTAYRTNEPLSVEQVEQLIVDCCDEILRKNPDTGKHEGDPDGPLRFDGGDERWGDNVSTARDCVHALYNLDITPLAADGHALALIPWLQGLDAEVAARVEGKSGAPGDS